MHLLPLAPAVDRVVREGRVRIGALIPVPAILREFGVAPEPALGEFGLVLEDFVNPDNTIEFKTMGRLLERCAQLTRCPYFGLLLGERVTASSFGAVGFLLQSSPDVRTALQNFSRHYAVHNPNATVSLVEERSYAALRFTLLKADVEGREHILDGAMAVASNLMRALCGNRWYPTEVRFAHAAPPDGARFRKFFRSALRFDAEETELFFEALWLDGAPQGADPLLNMMMAQLVGEIEGRFEENLVGELRRMLPILVASRKASIAVAAKRLGFGLRTLSRRLAEEGTSFTLMRDEARQSLAYHLLEQTHVPANEIGDYLGYANPSAFTRAFRRWTGAAPAQWRASRRHG